MIITGLFNINLYKYNSKLVLIYNANNTGYNTIKIEKPT